MMPLRVSSSLRRSTTCSFTSRRSLPSLPSRSGAMEESFSRSVGSLVSRFIRSARQIELRRADLVVGAEARVRLAHEAAEIVEVVALEGFDGACDACDLADDMARAAQRDVGDVDRLDVIERDVAKRREVGAGEDA